MRGHKIPVAPSPQAHPSLEQPALLCKAPAVTDTLIQACWITQSQVSQLAQALQFTECLKRGQRLAVLEQLDRPGKRQGLEIKLRKGHPPKIFSLSMIKFQSVLWESF